MAFQWSSLSAVLLLTSVAMANEFEVSANVGFEGRYFFEQGAYAEQFSHMQSSVFAEAELYYDWNDGSDSLVFVPFYRLDNQDSQRTHADIRELSYVHVADNWELRLGIRKEFWGVTEFQHLVDVINQTDAVEDIDGEDKLGQPMINLSIVKDWGITDLYLLPGFRERSFAGKKGRLRGPLVVDTGSVSYESSAQQKHVDYALRWSHSLGDFDLGSYWFHGTNREPMLTVSSTSSTLTPYYQQMDQIGVDYQATLGSWLWKLEGLYRDTKLDDFFASQAGLEYTFVGFFDTFTDLGLLLEYAWDSRGQASESSTGANLQNDLFLGARIALNDAQSSELLLGLRADLEHNSQSLFIEANRRLADNYKIGLDIRLLQSSYQYDQVYYLNEDDHLQVSIERYF